MVSFLFLLIDRELHLPEASQVHPQVCVRHRQVDHNLVVIGLPVPAHKVQVAGVWLELSGLLLLQPKLGLDHLLSDFGENLLRRVHCVELLHLARPHEPDVLVRDYLVDGVVLGVGSQPVFKVLHLAAIDSIKSDQRTLLYHFTPVGELVEEGAICFELWLRPELEAEHSQHVLERLLAHRAFLLRSQETAPFF